MDTTTPDTLTLKNASVALTTSGPALILGIDPIKLVLEGSSTLTGFNNTAMCGSSIHSEYPANVTIGGSGSLTLNGTHDIFGSFRVGDLTLIDTATLNSPCGTVIGCLSQGSVTTLNAVIAYAGAKIVFGTVTIPKGEEKSYNDLSFMNDSEMVVNGKLTMTLPTGKTFDDVKAHLTGTGTVTVDSASYIKMGSEWVAYGGDISSAGLYLTTDNKPDTDTVYHAGNGIALWEPGTGLESDTFTLDSATITVNTTSKRIAAITLPDVQNGVNVVFKGNNTITANSTEITTVLQCNGITTIDLQKDSDTTLNIGMQPFKSTGIDFRGNKKSDTCEITGTGKLTVIAATDALTATAITTRQLTLDGGTLALQGNVTGDILLGGVTISAGTELHLEMAQSVNIAEAGAVNNGLLILPNGTTVKQIDDLDLTGDGYLRVMSDHGTNLYYTNDGVELVKLVNNDGANSALMFMAADGFDEDANLEKDGYSYTCVTNKEGKKDYTIRLGNLVIESDDTAISLPDDGNVTLELVAGTTTHIKSSGGNSIVFNFKEGEFFTHTIKGSGNLVMQVTTGYGQCAIHTTNRLNITGGDITIYNDGTDGLGIDAYSGDSKQGKDKVHIVNITGGKLNITAERGAIAARNMIALSNNMQITSPKGAAVKRCDTTDFSYDMIGYDDNEQATSVVIEPRSALPSGGDYTPSSVTVYNDPSVPDATVCLTGSGLSSSDLLVTERSPKGSAYDALLKLADSDAVFKTYNIYLKSGRKSTGSAMDLTFDLNARYAGQDFTLVHQKADSTYEYFYDTADANGDLKFGPLYELSPFMLVKGRLTASSANIPQMGDDTRSALWIGAALLIVAVSLAAAALRKGRRY